MDAADTIEAVEEATTTERSRIGSDKALIAATGANLEADAIWTAAATREAGLRDGLEGWAGDARESDLDAVADAFDRATSAAGDRAERIDAAPGDADALSAHLDTVDGTSERVGAGLVAPALVLDRFYLQVVSFFVNEAEEGSADVVRDLRSGASDLGPARDALAALDESGRERARDAAVEAVGVAYREYADALESMGLDPKPVC
ncbi:transcription antitermination protein [Haloarcula onubensis]|uniref:Transcription antitermination protein n=1 Tax=Haloarcula onubensis TaxID=2950539 RepID=A0ABU2FKI3_9EURY|nr:transcription antitermination protein [Halomicroarcula sp. S3CR25-11]MDS0280871.1 transcription antitermination protein [Halomicroarcula sp. S3CR25-11]